MSRVRARKTKFKGKVYDSRLEATYAQLWDAKKAGGEIVKIERQVPLELKVNGTKVCKLIVDWRLTYKDGRVVWTEAKGPAGDTANWRLKVKLMLAIYPDINYEVYGVLRKKKGRLSVYKGT